MKSIMGNADSSRAVLDRIYKAEGDTNYTMESSNGFRGRVGEYDSMQSSAGMNMQTAILYPKKNVSIKSTAGIRSSDDYFTSTEVHVDNRLKAGVKARSLVQQQDTYAMYSPLSLGIYPAGTGLIWTQNIPQGSVYGIQRRLADGYLNYAPHKHIEFFGKGDMQAQVGTRHMSYLDQNYDGQCGSCHITSRFQQVNQTTRGVTGGAKIDAGSTVLRYLHTFNSFKSRVEAPVALIHDLPLKSSELNTPEVCATTYKGSNFCNANDADDATDPKILNGRNIYIQTVAPTVYHADSLLVHTMIGRSALFTGDATYTRLQDQLLNHGQNKLTANATTSWNPNARLLLNADFHEDALINNFTPVFDLFGNVSHHKHTEGIDAIYRLSNTMTAESYYRHGVITRSNAFRWPQVYTQDNSDWFFVIPQSTENTAGFRFSLNQSTFRNSAGYEYIHTEHPGFYTVPGSDNKVYLRSSAQIGKFLTLSNDVNARFENAFTSQGTHHWHALSLGDPATWQETITRRRRDRFYNETMSLSAPLAGFGNASFNYSYQQNKLDTAMDMEDTPFLETDFVLRYPDVPYNQINQSYQGKVNGSALRNHLEISAELSYNSARSRMNPDVNPNDALLLGNARFIANGACTGVWPGNAYITATNTVGSTSPATTCFRQDLFAGALQEVNRAATTVSAVQDAQWLGESKAYYKLPKNFRLGYDFRIGTYKDAWTTWQSGVLRNFTWSLGRNW